MLNVYIFSMVNLVMDTDLIAPEDYDSITQSKAIFIQVFRNSIGDIGMTKIGPWKNIHVDDALLSDCAMFIIWAFWFVNVFTMTIVFLNFVIAEVGNTYNNIKSSGTIFLYQKKAEMNMLA